MDYKTIYFRRSQFEEYSRFIKSLSFWRDKPIGSLVSKWWESANIFDGYLCLAYNNNDIIARFSISGRKIWCSNNIIDSFEIGGGWTAENHRRRGLFTKLVTQALELGFAAGAKLIYGTPNARSGPGCKKLNFSFVDTEDCYLILIPNLTRVVHIALKKAGLVKGEYISHIKRDTVCKQLLKSTEIKEITSVDYILGTKCFRRMNYTSVEYLEWRLSTLRYGIYRFFHGLCEDGEFYCVLRTYTLGFLENILVSEYFLNGQIDNTMSKIHFLKAIASAYYRNYDGIYLKSYVNNGLLKDINQIRYRFIIHRQLPICYLFNNVLQEKGNEIMSEVAKVFQMSDCDIG